MTTYNPTPDSEAAALAACYHLLLQKAAERHKRLAETAVSSPSPLNEQESMAQGKPYHEQANQ